MSIYLGSMRSRMRTMFVMSCASSLFHVPSRQSTRRLSFPGVCCTCSEGLFIERFLRNHEFEVTQRVNPGSTHPASFARNLIAIRLADCDHLLFRLEQRASSIQRYRTSRL